MIWEACAIMRRPSGTVPGLRQGVLSRIYQTEGCYQAAIDFEFEKFLAEWPKGANRQQDLAAVWELLARLKSMNAALVTREAAASGTGRYLEQVLLGGRMRQTVSGMKGRTGILSGADSVPETARRLHGLAGKDFGSVYPGAGRHWPAGQ